jgi:hypothetical protein
VDKQYTWIGKGKKELTEHTITKPTMTRTKHTEKQDDVCPHGYSFGKDFDEHDECVDNCKMWEECQNEKIRLCGHN